MKLSTITAKLKSHTTNIIAAMALAAGALTLATPAAQAQGFYFGFHAGPRYVAPPPPVYRPYFYGYDHHPYWHHDYRHYGYYR